MKVAVAFDHRGVHLRDASSRRCARAATTSSTSAPTPTSVRIDYPDKAAELGDGAPAAARRSAACSSAAPASAPAVAACKIAGIRAAICHDAYSAHQGVEHDDMNILCLGSEVVGPSLAADLVRAFLGARFDGGARYVARLEKVKRWKERCTWLSRGSTSSARTGSRSGSTTSRATCSTRAS